MPVSLTITGQNADELVSQLETALSALKPRQDAPQPPPASLEPAAAQTSTDLPPWARSS